MAPRILLQLFLVALPFVLYGLFRLATRDAREKGHAWPYQILFMSGLAISAAGWVYLALNEPRSRAACYAPSQFVDGELVKGQRIPCPEDVADNRTIEDITQSTEGASKPVEGPERAQVEPREIPGPDPR